MKRPLGARESAIAVLRDAYLARKLGAVCDAILEAAAAAAAAEPDELLLDAAQLRSLAQRAKANPHAWIIGELRGCATGPGANKRWRVCRDCPNPIPPTYTRGQPAKRCAECRGANAAVADG